jgi:hypothetical protein
VVVGYFFVRLWFSVYIVPVKHCPLVQIHSPYLEVEQLLQVRSFLAFHASGFLQIIHRRSRLDDKSDWGHFYRCLSFDDH